MGNNRVRYRLDIIFPLSDQYNLGWENVGSDYLKRRPKIKYGDVYSFNISKFVLIVVQVQIIVFFSPRDPKGQVHQCWNQNETERRASFMIGSKTGNFFEVWEPPKWFRCESHLSKWPVLWLLIFQRIHAQYLCRHTLFKYTKFVFPGASTVRETISKPFDWHIEFRQRCPHENLWNPLHAAVHQFPRPRRHSFTHSWT
jgi:hypothetical protein